VWLVLQTTPQVPQFVMLASTSVSQPSVRALLLQSPQPLAHTARQLPPPQAGDGMWLFEHAAPQLPQLTGSDETSATFVLPCEVV
jgi:hypothetical protein